MRKSISILAIVAALFMVFSCQKESTTVLRATINQYNGNNGKAYLAADDYVNWHVGDELWVNGCEATVTGSASPFTVTVSHLAENTETFYAVFPKAYSTMDQSNNATVTIPAVQKYIVKDGHQVINAPMAAKQQKAASGATTLMFYNLASLLEITLPDALNGATINKIVVSNIVNNGNAINGNATVNFEAANGITIGQLNNGTRATSLEVNAQYTTGQKFYVAVAPVENAQFEVIVNYETATKNLGVFHVKQGSATNTIPVNNIAPIDLHSTNFNEDNSYDPYFSDSYDNDGHSHTPNYYYISPGNVQLYMNSDGHYHYRFAEHQWDIIGGANIVNGALSTTAIDLFPYGRANAPFEADQLTGANEMLEFASSGYTCDFTSDWITPHLKPTEHVLAKNGGHLNNTNNNGNDVYFGTDASLATISVGTTTHTGLIVLPDKYPGQRFTASRNSHSIVTIGAEQWFQMEAMGAIFLPLTGQLTYDHNNTNPRWTGGTVDAGDSHGLLGYYTYKDPAGNNSAHYLIINDGQQHKVYSINRNGEYHSRAFRLIRNVPGYTNTVWWTNY